MPSRRPRLLDSTSVMQTDANAPTRVVKATLQWFCTKCGQASIGSPIEYDEWRAAHVCDPTIKRL